MDFKIPRSGSLYSTGLVSLFFFVLTPLWPQIEIPISLSEQPTIVGREVELRISLPMQSLEEVEGLEWTIPALAEGMEYVGPFELSPAFNAQGAIAGYDLSVLLTAARTGRFIIPVFQFFQSGREYKSTPTLYEVSDDGSSQGVPFSLRWRGTQELYVGQSALYVLEIYLSREYQLPNTVSISAPASGLFEEIFDLRAVETELLGSTVLYTIPVASFLYTPTIAGNLLLPAATIQSNQWAVESLPLDITVIQLPEQVDRFGAVGEFTYHHKVSQQNITLEEFLTVEIIIEGNGNLPLVNIPTPNVASYLPDSRNEISNIQALEIGYVGSRTVLFQYSFLEAGTYSVEIPSFTAFNPQEGEVYLVEGARYEVHAYDASKIQNAELWRRFRVEEKELEVLHGGNFHMLPWAWALFAFGPLCSIGWFIFRRKILVIVLLLCAGFIFLMSLRSVVELDSNLTQIVSLLEEGNIVQGIDHARAALLQHPRSAAIHHLLSLLYAEHNDIAYAISHARISLRLYPQSMYLQSALSDIERRFSLSQQFPVPSFFFPDSIFIVLLVVWNLGWIGSFLLYSLRRPAALIIFATSAALVCLVSVSIFLYARSVLYDVEAVVNVAQSPMKKIPEYDARVWTTLPRGTAVRIEERYHEFYQVKTNGGKMGWIEAENVLYQREFF